MIGAGGVFASPKPWDYKPPEINADNFWDLTDKEIEELTEEELYLIGRNLWKRMPTKDTYKLVEKIIKKKNGKISIKKLK